MADPPLCMFRYLTAAFWASPEIAGLGRLPANAIAVAGMVILGFGHPGFWLLGLGLEAAYLFALTTSARFRKLVDAQELDLSEESAAEQRHALAAKLGETAQARLAALEQRTARILQLHRDSEKEDFEIDANRDALKKLGWIYLKLLVAQGNLESIGSSQKEQGLAAKIAALEEDLRDPEITPSLLESKKATLRLLRQRLQSAERREETMEEIESDLARIEAQVDLAHDNAGLRGQGGAVSFNIDLASRLLDDSLYGDSSSSIAELDRAYQQESA
ncbi:hypothetical protein OKA05_17570 [Luteolibacter arcticus]|uniref:Uncharacterized protein n=1 Tax=Luteolibacter arcticus TaxID=1581411 RepID=A0ABT3GLM7_9BACT|nr:hypothetical protein [Luteolibacter arcticus]MCW1924380.1 hypothetical protein [Luteolibacter arcticus]